MFYQKKQHALVLRASRSMQCSKFLLNSMGKPPCSLRLFSPGARNFTGALEVIMFGLTSSLTVPVVLGKHCVVNRRLLVTGSSATTINATTYAPVSYSSTKAWRPTNDAQISPWWCLDRNGENCFVCDLRSKLWVHYMCTCKLRKSRTVSCARELKWLVVVLV